MVGYSVTLKMSVDFMRQGDRTDSAGKFFAEGMATAFGVGTGVSAVCD